MTCGTKDGLFERNEKVLEVLNKNSIAYDWYSVEGGEHDYECFDEGLRYAFERL